MSKKKKKSNKYFVVNSNGVGSRCCDATCFDIQEDKRYMQIAGK